MTGDTTRNILIYLIIFTQLVLVIVMIGQSVRIKNIMCDISSGFGAERMYTWNIIRDYTGRDPATEAPEVRNPVLTEEKYVCK